MKRTIITSFIAATMMIGSLTAQAEEIRVGGGGAAMSTVIDPIVAQYEKATGNLISRRPSSPKGGLTDLIGGKVDMATAAVSLESMISGAAKDGITIDRNTLHQETIGTNKTVLFVHPSNKVAKLSNDQIRGIFTGKITNWKDVGGDDRVIIVVWGIGTPGQNAQFIKEVLGGESVTKEAMETTNYAAIKESVASTPEAVGIDPYGLADDTVRVIPNDPDLTSPIIAVTNGKPSAKVQKLIDYIKGEGKKFTKQQ